MLPTSRIEELAGDVYFQWIRRYPALKENSDPLGSPTATYDDSGTGELEASESLLKEIGSSGSLRWDPPLRPEVKMGRSWCCPLW
ncbi:component of the polarisome [Paramarasmius palmivorus]|uniref:Component of the polarisome n=1 Tax=Paramarasmius palmivorus TaxID=297713 RepID=A0AAW0CEU9_9AGAR